MFVWTGWLALVLKFSDRLKRSLTRSASFVRIPIAETYLFIYRVRATVAFGIELFLTSLTDKRTERLYQC